jgi:uncharacterized protein YecE (DUF72 family)
LSDSTENICIGTAGWSYKDWHGIFYPESPEKKIKELDYLAHFFNTVEINSTFYRPANLYMSEAWVRKVAHNPDFLFTAKLWQRFTHDRKEYSLEEVKMVTDGMAPLMQAQKLGAILCQFPWSFKNDETGRQWLSGLFTTFRDYPLVVELRHSSWDVPATYELLENANIGIAAIDQPVIGKSIVFKSMRTGKIGYVRMHGRNYKAWFAKKDDPIQNKSPMARYDYLYAGNEIKEIAEKVKIVSKDAKQTFVIQNNHPWGQAVANALQLKSALGETDIKIPPTMLHRFPDLAKIGDVASPE